MTGGRPAERPSPSSGPGVRADPAPSRRSDRSAPPAPGAAQGSVHPEIASKGASPITGKAGDTTTGKAAGAKPGARPGGKARRPALTSDHFSLTWRRGDPSRAVVAIHRAPRLMMAVAKKLMPRAIDRNTVRRIARESWRAVAGRHPDLDLFVRLQAKPLAWSALPDGQRKRACRLELDGLLARLPAAGGAR